MLLALAGAAPSTLLAENASISAQQQKRTIKGTVRFKSDKEPVIGANVWLKNSSTGAITDLDGNYSISIDGVGGVLVFSYTGYKTVEIALNDKTVIDVDFEEDSEVIEEVVVVGYGSQKKASVVGAISTVNVKDLKVPSSNLSNALAGQLAGVVAMNRSGEPGKNSSSEFYIRGVSSFTGNASPLVLVDGIERELDLVDTEDIASFSILKDASASAVYGVRGANGVILITTRKGAEGKPQINVRAEGGITQPTKMPSMVNSAQWAELYNEAAGKKYYSDEVIDKYRTNADRDLYPNVNWIDELYDDFASNQKVNLNISGGGDIVKYYVAGSFYNESSIFKSAGNVYDYNSSIKYNKFNFRANMDINVTKTTVLNVNMANIYEKSFGPGSETGNIWGYTFATSPNAFPTQYSDGTIAAPSAASGYNPWNLLVHSGYREQFWNSSQSLIGLNQKLDMITKGLTANIKFSWDAFNTTLQTRTKEPKQFHAIGRDEDGNLIYGTAIYQGQTDLTYGRSTDGTMTTYMEGSLNYDRLFAEKHRVGALLLYNHKIHTKTQAGDQSSSLPYKNQGLAGRLTYAFNDTYFAEFNLGYNGSENFARGHRFGFFPAGALGWMVSNENWFEPAKEYFDNFKLKASYGIVGNDDIGGYRRWIYMPTIVSSGSFNYGNTANLGGSGIRVGDVENLSVSWEEAKKLNVGVEFTFLNSIKLQADYFHEKRDGIFLQRAGLPALVGLSTVPYTNIGKAENKGFDGTLEYDKKVGEVFLTARGNFSFSKNKLIDNDEPDWLYKYQNSIGKSFGSGTSSHTKGLVALGLFESQEEIDNSPTQTFGTYRVGDLKYQDTNGDGKIDSNDMVALGYTNIPEITYGIGMTAQWRNFDVNVFFQGIDHVNFFLSGNSIKSIFGSNNMERSAINADVYDNVWKSTNTAEQNADVLYPRLALSGAAGSVNNAQTSDYWMRDGSFIRLKNAEIGYSLPKELVSKTFIKSVRFYLSGNNLLTFSKFKLWDPEKGGGEGAGYPQSRIISVGFNANF
ncbi:MAG: TonB-dependent receptor [Bacteroidales bacterium]|nr:TonB-dependent receptor [Bacteroidales bacterium]